MTRGGLIGVLRLFLCRSPAPEIMASDLRRRHPSLMCFLIIIRFRSLSLSLSFFVLRPLGRISYNGQPSGAPLQPSRDGRRRQCHYRHYRRLIRCRRPLHGIVGRPTSGVRHAEDLVRSPTRLRQRPCHISVMRDILSAQRSPGGAAASSPGRKPRVGDPINPLAPEGRQ